MEESKYLEKIEMDIMDADAESDDKTKVKYIFQSMVNTLIEDENFKLDLKDAKSSLKEGGFEPARMVEAIKYMAKDGINVKAEQADIIDDYMLKLEKSPDDFEGLQEPLITTMERIEEVKDAKKNIKDKSGALGVDYKAIEKISKNYVDNINPNKKPKKDDIVLEGIIEEYEALVG